MSFCTKCGESISDSAAFCAKCGAPSHPHVETTSQAAAVPEDDSCASCGAVLKPGAAFCIACGTETGEASAPTQQPGIDKTSSAKRSRPLLLTSVVIVAIAMIAAGAWFGWTQLSNNGAGSDETALSASTTSTTAPATTVERNIYGDGFKIAIVAPSASNDLAFTQSMVDAANLLVENGTIGEVAVTDGTWVLDDAAVAIRDYASGGYDLVIGHGEMYGGSIWEIAKDFPETSFAWGTSADTFGLDNVYAYEAASDQGGRVMGLMAAALSTNNNVGVVGPIEVGDAKLYVDGFRAGVLANKPSATVNVSYIDSFSDVALAAEAATSLVGAGADVLSGTSQMVTGAITQAKAEGVPWFGTQANQTDLAPSIVVASQVYHWEHMLEEMVNNVKDGKLGSESYEITFANDGLVIEYNEDYPLPDDVRKLGDDAVQVFKDTASGDDDVAAGSDDTTTTTGNMTTTVAAGDGETFKVAFVHVGPTADKGWSWAHDQGAKYLQNKMAGVVITTLESIPEGPDSQRVFENLAADGNQLIFGTSFGYMDPMLAAAENFPDVAFMHATGYKTSENMGNYFGAAEEGRYLSGMAAGERTETNLIGYVAAFAIPEVLRGINAFTLGVQEVNPDAEVQVVWTSTWFDPPKEGDAAQALLDSGADVIAMHQDSSAPGQAAEAADAGWVGYNTDMSEFAPNGWLTAPIWHWGPFYLRTAEDVKVGRWKAEDVYANMKDGIVAIAPFGPSVSDDMKTLIETRQQEIIDGTFTVFPDPIVNQDGVEQPLGNIFSMDFFVEGVIGSPTS